MADAERNDKGQYQPGQSGNPKGRPKGARSKFTERFLKDFLADFEAHGASAIKQVRETSPGTYLKIAASIIPKTLSDDEGNLPAAYLVVPSRGAESLDGIEIVDENN